MEAGTPPSKATDAIQEDGVLTLYKLPHSDLQAFTKLENTATQALRDMVSKLISHLPTFKVIKSRDTMYRPSLVNLMSDMDETMSE